MLINTLIKTIILSILPISELRGGIPFAFASGMSIYSAFFVSTLSNILIIPIFFIFLETLNKLFLKIKWYNKFFNKNLEKARNKIKSKVEKYGYLGLLIFVAIPLPVTGAYTGTLGAWALNMDRKKSFYYISLGVLIAGLIVSIVVYSGTHLFNIFLK